MQNDRNWSLTARIDELLFSILPTSFCPLLLFYPFLLFIFFSYFFLQFTFTIFFPSSAFTVIRFTWVRAKFGTCTVVSVNGTLVEDKMRRFKGECAHFCFNNCFIYTHDGASAKFSTNSHETDNSVPTSSSLNYSIFKILLSILSSCFSGWSRGFPPQEKKVGKSKVLVLPAGIPNFRQTIKLSTG